MSGGYKTCLIHAVGGVYDPFLSVDSRGEVQVYLYTVQENEGGGGDDDTSKLGQRASQCLLAWASVWACRVDVTSATNHGLAFVLRRLG